MIYPSQMNTNDLAPILSNLFAELTTGAPNEGAFIVNAGDPGLLRSLDKLSAIEASRSTHGGATIAAHAAHVSYGLLLMNRWAREGGNPFASAQWDEAWKITTVNDQQWQQIRKDLGEQVESWLSVLRSPRDVMEIELSGMIGSVAHLAYHLGAIRQIAAIARGPKEGTTAISDHAHR